MVYFFFILAFITKKLIILYDIKIKSYNKIANVENAGSC